MSDNAHFFSQRAYAHIWAYLAVFFLSLLASPSSNAQDISSDISAPQKNLKESGYIQSRDYPEDAEKERDKIKSISLKAAIEEGLRKNFGEQIRQFEREQLELDWKDTEVSFWYPNLELTLKTMPHSMGTWREGTLPGDVASEDPSGNVTFGFEDYTLFNWGKDYLNYLNSKDSYKRSKTVLEEERRELRHTILKRYFKMITQKKIEKIHRQQLRHASYIYNLNREKIKLGKISKREYYQARSEYLRAQTEFSIERNNRKLAEEALAEVLIHPEGTKYATKERIDFNPFDMRLSQAKQLASSHNPRVLESQKDLRLSNRNYDIEKRENLPLPELSVDLGAYTHSFGPNGSSTRYRTGPNSSNIELVATLNATWSIFGDGGLLNARDIRNKYLDKLISEKGVRQAEHVAHSNIKSLMQKIQHYERQIEILDAREVSLQKMFDTTLDDYMDEKTDFQDVRQALLEKTQAEKLRAQSYYLHMQNKINLAETLGVSDFPGENFNDQTIKENI